MVMAQEVSDKCGGKRGTAEAAIAQALTTDGGEHQA